MTLMPTLRPQDGPQELEGTTGDLHGATQAQHGIPRRQAHPSPRHHRYFGSTKVQPKFHRGLSPRKPSGANGPV